MFLADARDIAEEVVALLRPGCERIEIAGSIRRECAEVGDIELVAIPHPDEGLFAAADAPPSLECVIEYVLMSDELGWDAETPRNGARYKRFYHRRSGGIPVDLFLASPDNWGNILTIRTGGAGFSHWLVTRRSWGGALPPCYLHIDGYLVRRETMERVACPTEAALFEAVGVRWIEPRERSGDDSNRWRRLLR